MLTDIEVNVATKQKLDISKIIRLVFMGKNTRLGEEFWKETATLPGVQLASTGACFLRKKIDHIHRILIVRTH